MSNIKIIKIRFVDTFKKSKTLPFANIPMASATAPPVIPQLRSTHPSQNHQKAPCRHNVCDLHIVMVNKNTIDLNYCFLFLVYLNGLIASQNYFILN